MAKVSELLRICILFSGLFVGMLFTNSTIAQQAPDVELIKIMPEFKGDQAEGFYLDPPTIYIRKNTIILWMNGVPEKEVQVVFQEGKTCRDVTANPDMQVPGFFLDARGCYVTSFLPFTKTSTLQFPENGQYAYEAVTEDGKMRAEGKIIVSD